MNAKRGLIRVWIVASILWVSLVFGLDGKSIVNDFKRYAIQHSEELYSEADLFIDCAHARGVLGRDYTKEEGEDGICVYHGVSSFRRFYPEYKSTDGYDLIVRFEASPGIMSNLAAHPWRHLLSNFLLCVLVPAATFALGAAGFWIVAGFRSKAV